MTHHMPTAPPLTEGICRFDATADPVPKRLEGTIARMLSYNA